MSEPTRVVAWSAAEAGARPMVFGPALHVLDLRGWAPGSVAIPPACGLLVVGSERAAGAWAAVAGDVPIAVAPAPEPSLGAGDPGPRLHLRPGAAPDAQVVAAVAAAARWAEREGIPYGIEGATTAASLALAARFGGAPALGAGSLALDLRPAGERLGGATGAVAPADVENAWARQAARRERWATGKAPHVLVVTGEAPNLVDIRVHLPFAALQRAGAIAGYTVLGPDGFADAVPAQRRFGAVWVQRSADPATLLMLRTLRVPFVYDLDDLLLVSPSYRPAFSAEASETVRAFLAAAALVSCATETLATHLPVPMGRVVVTPNLADSPPRRVAGPVRTLVWASSDRPALLAGAQARVARAVRDFARAHHLAVLCLGEVAADVFVRAGLRVEASGLLGYAAYCARLAAAAPGILVAPLETAGDTATQAFIDCKSDIKVIEARQAGLVGVFSRAGPYRTSDLEPEILCDNTYESWLEGLERGRAGLGATPPWPEWRDRGRLGLVPWIEAVRLVPTEVEAGAVRAAQAWARDQAAAPVAGPDRFDEADYLRRHPDVAEAVAAGSVRSGYAHYVAHGVAERRASRRLPSPDETGRAWFEGLLHVVARLERDVPARAGAIAGLAGRAALTVPPPDDGVAWHPGGSVGGDCPVCGAPGPHPVLLRQAAQVLARCGSCGSAASEDRSVHRYEEDAQADTLLQLYLEQNAGVHQLTGLLFATGAAGSLLDVGCGFGFAVGFARDQLGWRAVGLDPGFMAREGRRLLGADIRPTALSVRTKLGDGFAVVTASEVLEHVADPHPFLRLLRGRVARGGALVLTTPDAEALRPGIGRARTLAITAPRVHLTLFTAGSLAGALERAGFGDVRVWRQGDGLVAVASDGAPAPPADAAERHGRAYRSYLERLVAAHEPGSPLWNGAAGRLLAALEETPAAFDALAGRIGEAWRGRYGIDFERLLLPEPVPGESAAALAGRQPLNLGPVLLRLARRAGAEGRALAGAAARVAAHAEATLAAANMIDHDLRETAARARLLSEAWLPSAGPPLKHPE